MNLLSKGKNYYQKYKTILRIVTVYPVETKPLLYKEHGAPLIFAKEEWTLDKVWSHTGMNDQHIQTSNPLKTYTYISCT